MNPDIPKAVRSVAVLIDDRGAFCLQANRIAAQLGPSAILKLTELFHSPGNAPPEFEPEERGLGGWLASWQFAIFEVFYNFKEAALPILRQVAFGEYDWTQANAIEILCRLAAEGIERERTLSDLRRHMPHMRDTALIYVAGPLLEQAKTNAATAEIVEELLKIDAFRIEVDCMREAEEQRGKPWPIIDDLVGLVTRIENVDAVEWNLHIIGRLVLEGIRYGLFSVWNESFDGRVQIAVSDRADIKRMVDGRRTPAEFGSITLNDRIAIGHYSGQTMTEPVTIHPEAILILGN
jgi:hypothetical protein